MANRITTDADVEISCILHYAKRAVVGRKIVSELLSGLLNVQTIGTATIKYTVHLYALSESRAILDTLCLEGAEFKLWYDDLELIGLIQEESLDWSLIRYTAGIDWAEVTFTFVVIEDLT